MPLKNMQNAIQKALKRHFFQKITKHVYGHSPPLVNRVKAYALSLKIVLLHSNKSVFYIAWF